MEDLSLSRLLEAASDFATYPGFQNEESAKSFLDRFPLPVMISALQSKPDMPGLESTLAACLERIFKTKCGTSLIPQNMPFVQVGLQAESQILRCLACKTVSSLMQNADIDANTAAKLVVEYEIYSLLLDCLVNGNEQVATASTEAIRSLALSSKGMAIIFPANGNGATHLSNLAARCSSLGRIRIFALIVKLCADSGPVSSTIYNSNLLSLLEAEIVDTSDMLMTFSVLELLYELSEIPHGAKFLSKSTFLQLLTSMISNTTVESLLRSRAIMISGKLLSSESIRTDVDESSINAVFSAIDGRFKLLKDQDSDEFESMLEALGQIGSYVQGAELLLSSPAPLARHVVDAAFDRQGRGKQLAALHALGNISGENRPADHKVLNNPTEECLRRLIYDAAAKSSKLTPSGLFLSAIKQDPDIRLAVYRLITGLVARSWCLIEICSKQEMIDIVTDAHIESTKNGMEARYNCCKAIHLAFSASDKFLNDPSLAGVAVKLHEAVRRGPYLGREKIEAQPLVVTADRF